MKKKLAIIISHPIQHFCPLYSNWAKNGNWDIKVFFGSNAGMKTYFDLNFKKEISWKHLRTEDFNHEFLNGDQDLQINSKLDAPNLHEALKAFNPDILLMYGYDQKLQRRARSWAIKNNVKLIYFADSELRQYRNPIKLLFKKVWLPFYFKSIDYFLVTGNANEAYYLNYNVPQQKMIRASYPIDLDTYEDAWKKRETLSNNIRSLYKIPKDSIVISMVGKLIDRKRQIDLIHALSKVDDNLNITLLLIGTGEKEQEWKTEAQALQNHRVIFTGFIEAHELPAYYSATDIYAHVSEAEPHSVAISEAIYMGCPIIISDRCGSYGMDDDVQIATNGFVFACKNVDELRNIIEILSKNAEMRLTMSINSHLIAEKNQMVTHLEILNRLNNLFF